MRDAKERLFNSEQSLRAVTTATGAEVLLFGGIIDVLQQYGARKQLSISNHKDDAILDRFLEQHEADDRLFAFKAFETVWHAKDGTRCSTWQVMDIISLRPKTEVADHTPEQPVVPTQEEINF